MRLSFHSPQVALDFFEYFAAAAPVLEGDPTLWRAEAPAPFDHSPITFQLFANHTIKLCARRRCVSSWNDNGKARHVWDAARLERSDFFPVRADTVSCERIMRISRDPIVAQSAGVIAPPTHTI